jgi:hypothetical protein
VAPKCWDAEALDLESHGLALGGGQSGTPNLGSSWIPTTQMWGSARQPWGSQARAGRQIQARVQPQQDSRFGVPRADPWKARPERDATSRHLLTRNEPLAAGWSRGSKARAGRQILARGEPERATRFGVPRAGPGGDRPERDAKSRLLFSPNEPPDLESPRPERDSISRHLLSTNEPLDFASRGLVLEEPAQSGTPNLGTC